MNRLTKDNDTQYDFVGKYDTNIEEFTNNKELRNAVLNKLGQLEDLEEVSENLNKELEAYIDQLKDQINTLKIQLNKKVESGVYNKEQVTAILQALKDKLQEEFGEDYKEIVGDLLD